MNPVFQAAAEANDLGWLMGVTTILFILSFLGWVWWAYSPSRKAHFEEAGRIPFDDESGGVP
ncbi:MAG: cbb3-type cytochrome c oxidase subunit 3 [Deltaproteobacteria bacterium]|nr:cbb3-type cytochrome c oxidase subunit 3 [Deltaproteobacteria bacterium]